MWIKISQLRIKLKDMRGIRIFRVRFRYRISLLLLQLERKVLYSIEFQTRLSLTTTAPVNKVNKELPLHSKIKIQQA